MYIRHNISALNTTRNLTSANKGIHKSTERLSTGFKINRAGDDVAGLSISEKMRAQISGLTKASTNTQDSISLIQTAESSLEEVNRVLIRIRELAIQSANDTNIDADRQKLGLELKSLLGEVDRIAQDTEFNTMKLLDGSVENLKLQLGANDQQNTDFSLNAISTESLSIQDISINTQEDANNSLGLLDQAAVQVSEQRSYLGAMQNRLGHTIQNNSQTGANLSLADAVIRDANIAFESMDLTKEQILKNTMESAMTHSNMKNNWVLELLQ